MPKKEKRLRKRTSEKTWHGEVQLHHAFSIGMKMFIKKFKDLKHTYAFLFNDLGACSSI